MTTTPRAQEWLARLAAAALGAGTVLTFNAAKERLRSPASERSSTQLLQADRAASRPSSAQSEPTPEGTSAGSSTRAQARSAETPAGLQQGAQQLQQLNGQLEAAQRERDSLQRGKRALEGQVQSLSRELTERDRYSYDLTREEWQQLAAEGKVRYRAPCMMAREYKWQMPASEQDRLGLSPDDAEAVSAALLRSNRRVWDTLQPLCLQIVGKAEVVELLGGESCLTLIDKVAMREDFKKVIEARRQVAEVHAGLRAPPAAGEPQSPLFEALLLMSSEGKRFEADLAESFGPEDAQRIWRSMSCSSSRG